MFSCKFQLSFGVGILVFCWMLGLRTTGAVEITECLRQWDCKWNNEIPFEPTEGSCLFTTTVKNNTYEETPSGRARLSVICDRSTGPPSTMFKCLSTLSGGAEIQQLRLYDCDQLELKADDLDSFPFLEEFNISGGSIKSIDENALVLAEKLTTIDIYQDYSPNGITEYPLALIGPLVPDINATESTPVRNFLPNLRNLLLENFVFRSGIPTHAFQNLPDLNLLSLRSATVTNSDFRSMTQLTQLRHLQVTHSFEIDALPTELFPSLSNLISLDLSSNYISEILENDFVALPNLQSLTLSSTSIASVHPRAFEKLRNLLALNLSENIRFGLRNFVPSFRGLSSLETLLMGSCFYTNISEDVFEHVKDLRTLSLSGNKLRDIPIIFANIPSLPVTLADIESVDLSHNKITYVPGLMFRNLPKLKQLDLSYNYIQVIEKRTFYNLPAIEEIFLNNNEIFYFETRPFEEIETLRVLDLRWNYLSIFPSFPYYVNWQLGLDGLPQNPFQTYLDGNVLTCNCWMFYDLFVYSNTSQWTLPYYSINIWPGAFALSNQRFGDRPYLLCHTVFGVELVDAMLQAPLSFFSVVTTNCSTSCICYYQCMTELTFAICIGSNVTTVPNDLGSAITGIDLTDNKIKHLTVESFSHLPNLQTIDLSNNFISSIESGTFYNLGNLLTIILKNNSLTNVDSGSLNITSPVFTQLDLSDNFIYQLENDTFHSVPKMTWLELQNNQLQSLPKGILDNLQNLSYFTISGNPFNCTCDILYLTDWYKETVFGQNQNLFTDIDDLGCAPFLNETELYGWLEQQELICNPPPTADTVTKLVNVTQITPYSWKDQWEILVGCIGGAVTLTVLICGLIYKYRLEILVLIYIKTGLKPFAKQDDDEGKEYDAFISFSSLDRDFILEELVPRLEGHGSCRKLCIHHRDFIVGECIATNIVNAIENSKRIVIVCSNNYLKSEWCSYEFKTSHQQALKDRSRRIVLIVFDDIDEKFLDKEIKAYISTNTYLDKKDSLFWSKLMYAIPETRKPVNVNIGDVEMKERKGEHKISELQII